MPNFITFRVPHGCGTEAPTGLRVLLPQGIEYAVPMFKPGWTVEKSQYDGSRESGMSGVSNQYELRWSGSVLPPNTFVRFEVEVRLPNKPGESIFFKAVQECTDSDIRSVTIPEDDDMRWDVQNPVPSVLLLEPN